MTQFVRIVVGKQEVAAEGAAGLTPTQRSTLALWLFEPDAEQDRLVCRTAAPAKTLWKTYRYLDGEGIRVELNDEAEGILRKLATDREALAATRDAGWRIKQGRLPEEAHEVLSVLRTRLPRRLRPHQERAALFMLNVPNSANFSVPGSGKSSVVLAVYYWLRKTEGFRSLFVVGPTSSFGPWQHEYRETLGETPDVCILAGGSRTDRRVNYSPTATTISDLYLTTYQTLWQDSALAQQLLQHPANRVLLVIDEAHYIKREGGAWATAVLDVARVADRRCVLTGTPFPHSYGDAINIFDVCYPQTSPFTEKQRCKIRHASEQRDHEAAHEVVRPIIDPLFYRVREARSRACRPGLRRPHQRSDESRRATPVHRHRRPDPGLRRKGC